MRFRGNRRFLLFLVSGVVATSVFFIVRFVFLLMFFLWWGGVLFAGCFVDSLLGFSVFVWGSCSISYSWSVYAICGLVRSYFCTFVVSIVRFVKACLRDFVSFGLWFRMLWFIFRL